MMKKYLLLAVVSLLVAVSCAESPESPFTRKVSDYAVVTFDAPDLSNITDHGKEVLRLLFGEAG